MFKFLGLDIVNSANEMVGAGERVLGRRERGDRDVHVVEGRVDLAGAARVEKGAAEGGKEREGFGLSHFSPRNQEHVG